MDNMKLVDTHRHYGGCISSEFVWSAIQSCNARYLAESLDDVKQAMQFQQWEPRGFRRFLTKFAILDHLPWNVDLLRGSVQDVARGLELENVDYTWLRFSINKYLQTMRWHRRDLIALFKELFDEFAPGKVGLVLSLKYESERANQKQIAKLIEDDRVANCLVGIDLVGDEAYFDAEFYGPIFARWKDHKKLLFAHVGESCSRENVRLAIEKLGVTEICHGIAAADSPDILRCAKDNDACFHIAISSNIMTGVTPTLLDHPLPKLVKSGVKVAIGTDDPVICATTLCEEYVLAEHILCHHGLDAESTLDEIQRTAERRIYNMG